MSRNHANKLDKSVRRATWQPGLRLALWGASVVILAILIWLDLAALRQGVPWQPGRLLWLGVLGALLAWTSERLLAGLPSYRWRYRLAFLAGAGLPAALWLIQAALGRSGAATPQATGPAQHMVVLFAILASTALGAFTGCLCATGVNDGLWEDNSPPPEHIQAEVYRRHVASIGVPGRGLLSKRLFDFFLALFGLALAAPVWLLSLFLVWFEEPGPPLFVKNSVGKGGVNFRQFKLRTMVREAEEGTGPILSYAGDDRVLVSGRFLRKTALDELPQLVNILKGEMSFVGPRPQRTVLVCGYLQEMPEYAERHRVPPGLAGLAQVAGDYYLSPRQKLRFDRLYIRYSSLGFDLKLLFLAFLIAFWFRWRKDWDGRLPRSWLRFGSR
jgi:lipopolysaccharide/colanic/teichoic acid biosynthesis glycosyltransferase